MPVSPYALGADAAELDHLTDSQLTTLGHLNSVLSQFQGLAGKTVSEWDGVGVENYAAFNKVTEGEFTDLQTALNRFAVATGDSAANWRGAMGKILGMWGGGGGAAAP